METKPIKNERGVFDFVKLRRIPETVVITPTSLVSSLSCCTLYFKVVEVSL